MGWFDMLKKKEPTATPEQVSVPEESAPIESPEQQKERELNAKRERFNKILMQMTSILERIDLLEKKVNRLELKTGIKHETEEAR